MSIKECHTYSRWTTVHNFLLEKIPGKPLINKLRVIHIYEADWSFLQKYFVAFKLTKTAAYTGTLPVEQAGGRPGRSAIELATSKVLTHEIVRLQHIPAAVLYNNATACFDRIIENLSNITLMSEGLPIQVAQLHSQTFKTIKYYIKHKLGIGENSHSHLQPKPIYGVGQGATDAPGRWGFVCDSLLKAYKLYAHDAKIFSPFNDTILNNKISGFVDDTSTLITTTEELVKFLFIFLQRDAQLWEKLLHTSGGKMEIPKCKFAIFKWIMDSFGQYHLDNNINHHLHIVSSETNQINIIPQINTTDAYKYVGVHIALSGTMTPQRKILKQKILEMATILTISNSNCRETIQGLTTVFAPALTYPLPATSITQDNLRKIQIPLINTSLSKIGFNRHMPRVVVFASLHHGGIGLLDLYTEQCKAQCGILMSHL